MLKYYYLLFSTLIIGSCSLADNDQPIPSYLVINDVNVVTTANQGLPTHNIKDIWVYADNALLGVYELPTRVPILVKDESTRFTIYAGIRNNGETGRSFIYRLMVPEEFTLPLAPGEEVEKVLSFSYTENTIFDFVESFESSGHIFTLDLDENEETTIVVTDESAIAGQKSGKIKLDTENHKISVATIFSYDRAQNAGSDSYLEMDYKCDVPFFVGVIYVQQGQEVTQPLLVVNPQAEWNKLYVDFTTILTSPVLENYRVYFTTDLAPLNADSGEIFLDNLKFIHL
jgi:hypothetical protein